MSQMKSSSLRELRPKTSDILRQSEGPESSDIEEHHPNPHMPDREALIMSGPESIDSGRILEQDRT
jgi:hypothetical protein